MEALTEEGGFEGTERFEVLRRLGAGGFGAVYCVFDHRRNEQVALKVLHQRDADALYRFKREFRALADLVHPNLVALHELFSHGGDWFFTMELLDGCDFLSFVRGEERPSGALTVTSPQAIEPYEGDSSDGVSEQLFDEALAPLGSSEAALIRRGNEADTDSTQPVRIGTLPAARELQGRDGGTLPSAEPEAQRKLSPALAPTPAVVAGGTVGNRAPGQPRLSDTMADRLVRVLPQLVLGVHTLHRARQLHRDIKPSNVFVTRSGRLVLLDFGLVAELGAVRAGHEPIMGTPDYMAPEQLMGGDAGRAADWYAVGTMLYEAITNRFPFEGESEEVIRSKMLDDPPPVGSLVPSCPPTVAELTMQLLARDADLRPTGANLLARFGDGRALPAVGRPPSVYPAGGSVPPVDGAFVGRDAELRALHEALATARRGRQVTVGVHGPSGIGKSGLVLHFVRQVLRSEGAIVLRGRCDERESVPYKALDRMLDELCAYLQSRPLKEATALMPRHVHALARLFPVLQGVPAVQNAPGSQREPQVEPHELRRLAFAALRELLARLCDRAPVVLALDDLQWGDLDSAQLLVEVLRRPDPPNLLLIGCYRTGTEEASPFLQTLHGEIDAQRSELAIGPLSKDEARELGRSLVDQPVPDQKLDRIVREARGNPFFVGELVRFWCQSTGEAPTSAELSLDRVVEARIGRLSSEARRLLELVAVAGGPIADTVAIEAARLGEAARSTLAALRGAYLVRASAFDEGSIETYHARIRETVAAALDAETLRQHHRRLARALEDTGAFEPDLLILHYRGAGDTARAGELALDAARASAEGLAFEQAVTHFKTALELQELDPAEQLVVRRELADALANAGRGPEAAEQYLAASELTEGMSAVELRQNASLQLLITGRIDEGLELMEAVLPVYGLRLRRNQRMAALSLLLRRARLFFRGLDFKERSTDDIPPSTLRRIDSLMALASGLALVDVIRGSDLLTQALLLALEAGEPTRIVETLYGEVNFSATEGPGGVRRTRRLLDRLRRLAERYNSPKARGLVHLGAAFSYHLSSFEFDEARAEYEASLKALAGCPGEGWNRDTAGLMKLDLCWYTGRLRDLEALGDELLREGRRRGNRYVSHAVYTSASHMIWLAGDRPEELRELVTSSVSQWSQTGYHLQHWWELWALTQIDLYQGDGLSALERIRHRWKALRGSLLLTVQIVRIEAICALGRAWLAAAGRPGGPSPAAARRAVQRCARKLEREKVPWIAAWAKLLRAALCTTSDPEAARELLEDARQAFDGNGMKLYGAVARQRLAELVGGELGHSLGERASEYFRGEGIRDPDRMVALFAPRFAPTAGELPSASPPPQLPEASS